jgi:predicted permease
MDIGKTQHCESRTISMKRIHSILVNIKQFCISILCTYYIALERFRKLQEVFESQSKRKKVKLAASNKEAANSMIC